MITEALLHCRGIGPVRLAKLHVAGIRSWTDVTERSECLPSGFRAEVRDEAQRCLAALAAGDIRYFVERFQSADQWRIVAHYLEETTFFDIETTGLTNDASITVIVCWHRGRLHRFVEHENLDDFLSLLDEVSLLASFNGNSFDVPRVLDAFHIPALPCPHVDLRWSCHHQGLRGGLKAIARHFGIVRPADLQDVDGDLAVHLWNRWRMDNDRAARELLVRYCSADVLMLVLLAQRLAARDTPADAQLWTQLRTTTVAEEGVRQPRSIELAPPTGASPQRLRGLRIRRTG